MYITVLCLCAIAAQTIKADLDETSMCVAVWSDTIQHLLRGVTSADAAQTSSQLARISDRLRYLNRLCTAHLEQVESAIGGDIAHQV